MPSWNDGEHAGLVKLPDGRSLYLIGAGPAREHSRNNPAIIIEHGLESNRYEWFEVQRQVARFARVYVYERAGYVPSDKPADDPSQPWTALSVARDLKVLLETAGIEPPYILVGHSLGGLLVRRFLKEYGTALVAGLVIVDAAVIRTALPDNMHELMGNKTYAEVTGLEANSTIPAEERKVIHELDRQNADYAKRERATVDFELEKLHGEIGTQQLLGDRPLSVIFCDESVDATKIFEYAQRTGNGSAAAHEAMRKRLEDMSVVDEAAMRAHLTLTSNGRFVKADGKRQTHNVQMVDPEFVTGEIEWVWKQFTEHCKE